MKSINPVSGAVIKEYPTENLNAVTMKITDLQQTFIAWKLTSIEKRIECIKNAATMLRNNEAEYAYVITAEMGKIKKEALREVAKCATLCDYYADHAQEFLAPKFIATEAKKSYVAYCPLGIILGIMPWNFPFWQVFRFAVPTLLAGNVVILKHASNVPGCALLLETIFNAAAEDLNLEPFKTLLINTDMVSDVIANPLVRAVSLTGSVTAGKSVASIAGKHLKKTVLELGGSDPYLVLADADVKAAANACATGRLINCGQSCIAAKRFIVVADVYDEFLKYCWFLFSANNSDQYPRKFPRIFTRIVWASGMRIQSA
jgi:succinate-semialdehyde dehydrogenase/glutarate-semialdehyde dehydrogenase